MLAEPSVEKFSKAMLCLMKDETFRQKLGMAGKKLIEENFSSAAFNKRLNDLFDWLQTEIEQEYSLVVNTAVSPKPQVRS